MNSYEEGLLKRIHTLVNDVSYDLNEMRRLIGLFENKHEAVEAVS